MLEHAPHVKTECLMRAQVNLTWLEDVDGLSVLAEKGEFGLLNRELDRHKAFFKGIEERPEHGYRDGLSAEQAGAIVAHLDDAKIYAERKTVPRAPLDSLRRTLLNIAIDTAVECERGRE